MFKKLNIYLLAFLILTIASESILFAQTRVRFVRGRNSATVSGTIARGTMKTYVLRAGAGQSLTATLSSTNGKVDFTDGDVHDTQFVKTIDENGDVYLRIDNHGASTRFTLTISIQ